jgi:uncharacterized protein YlzI (FlbEa/FlbD family)
VTTEIDRVEGAGEMRSFIQATGKYSGTRMLLAVEAIGVIVEKFDGTSEIEINGELYHVQESYDEVCKLLADTQRSGEVAGGGG